MVLWIGPFGQELIIFRVKHTGKWSLRQKFGTAFSDTFSGILLYTRSISVSVTLVGFVMSCWKLRAFIIRIQDFVADCCSERRSKFRSPNMIISLLSDIDFSILFSNLAIQSIVLDGGL